MPRQVTLESIVVVLLFGMFSAMAPVARGQTGACCVLASCTVQSSFSCALAGGEFVGGSCSPNPCIGRCCSSGSCTMTFLAGCSGTFTGGGTCSPNTCPQPTGACCTSGCLLTTQAACAGAWSLGVSCSPNPCGACCDVSQAGGACHLTTQAACSGTSVFFDGAGSSCSPNPCVGACCDRTTIACTITTSVFCAPSGEFQGRLTVCSPDPCPALAGACCSYPFDQCVVRLASGCPDGVFTGGGATCFQAQCQLNAGACCTSGSSVCRIVPVGTCNGPGQISQFHGSACQPNPCFGACCNDTTLACDLRDSVSCTVIGGPNTYFAGQTSCSPNPCPSFAGACCSSAGCRMTLLGGCLGQGQHFAGVGSSCAALGPVGACCRGTACTAEPQACCGSGFQGAGTACGPAGNPTTCCPANFNRVGGLNVQDIFDFLSAWFAGDPRTDFNHAGGITIQDIFDYLAAWFMGCA